MIYLVAFLITCVGATLAYFAVINSNNVSATSKVESVTMTSLIFDAGNPISIYANMFNFGKDMNNLFDQTYAQATVSKGTDMEVARFHYEVSIDLLDNDLVYSVNKNKPEVILTITNPDDVEVKQIKGLDYVSIDGVSGFDITDKTGEYIVDANHEIMANNDKSFVNQVWKARVTLINLDADQEKNAGKKLNGLFKLKLLED